MKRFKMISPGNPRFQEIEFSLLLGWALLFPAKVSYAYFLGFMLLLAAFTLAKVFILRNISLSRFSAFLLLFNAVFFWGAAFSPHPYKSLMFVGDVLLVSLWLLFFYLEKADMERYLRLTALVVSISSLVVVVVFAGRAGRLPVAPLFENSIPQGIASALAALVFLHCLLRRFRVVELLLLALNVAAVVVSASKAAFLGLALVAAGMIFRRRRRWLAYLFALLLLLALAPNPLRRMVVHSLRRDPYVLNRVDIWGLSARMFRQHFWTGAGPDLFSEAAKRHNFPQENGPARYFKVPESPHSDYWKIIAENGLPGLVFVLLFLFFAIRRLLSPPGPDLAGWLLAFLLAEMLLFNFVFHLFFLVVFLLLLRDFFSAGRRFVAFRPWGRAMVAGVLAVALLILYLLPFLADRSLDRAAGENDLVRRYALLHKASRLSPLDVRAPLAKAALLRAFARSRFSSPGPKASEAAAAWADSLENARLAQRLDRYSIDALVLESELFNDRLQPGTPFPARAEEILGPLRRAGALDPCNPFLALQQAVVLREYGRDAEALERARYALGLEPDYAAAIVFLHELQGLPSGDPAFRRRLDAIREKAARLRSRPGSYLSRLHQLPVIAEER